MSNLIENSYKNTLKRAFLESSHVWLLNNLIKSKQTNIDLNIYLNFQFISIWSDNKTSDKFDNIFLIFILLYARHICVYTHIYI